MEAIQQATSIRRTFYRFTIPAVMAMLVNGLYQIVDGIFVGHYLGQDGLTAMNMAWPIISLLLGTGLMIGMGAGSLISTYRGRQDTGQARASLGNALIVIAFTGLASAAFLLQFGRPLLALQGAAGQTAEYATSYLQIFAEFSVISIAASAMPFLLRNDDSPKFATALMVLGAVLNTVLDYVMIGKLGWGLAGAAIATVTSQGVVLLLGLSYFLSRFSTLGIRPSACLPDPKKMADILALGSSSLVMYLYTGVMVALHNRLFMEYGSATHVAAYAIVGYLMTLYYLLAEGISEGMQPPVSYFHGEQAADKIRQTVWLACKVTCVVGISWIALLNVLPDTIIGWFNPGNAALQSEATNGIRLHLFGLFLDGLIVISSVYFMSVGRGGMALVISLANMLIQLPFLWLLPKWLGLAGVWLAMPLSNIVLAVFALTAMWRALHQPSTQLKFVNA